MLAEALRRRRCPIRRQRLHSARPATGLQLRAADVLSRPNGVGARHHVSSRHELRSVHRLPNDVHATASLLPAASEVHAVLDVSLAVFIAAADLRRDRDHVLCSGCRRDLCRAGHGLLFMQLRRDDDVLRSSRHHADAGNVRRQLCARHDLCPGCGLRARDQCDADLRRSIDVASDRRLRLSFDSGRHRRLQLRSKRFRPGRRGFRLLDRRSNHEPDIGTTDVRSACLHRAEHYDADLFGLHHDFELCRAGLLGTCIFRSGLLRSS